MKPAIKQISRPIDRRYLFCLIWFTDTLLVDYSMIYIYMRKNLNIYISDQQKQQQEINIKPSL